MLQHFSELIDKVKAMPRTVVCVANADSETVEAARMALDKGLADVILWKKAGIREKECSLRTAFRPPPCVPSPTVQNDSGDGAWTKTFFVIYCFY